MEVEPLTEDRLEGLRNELLTKAGWDDIEASQSFRDFDQLLRIYRIRNADEEFLLTALCLLEDVNAKHGPDAERRVLQEIFNAPLPPPCQEIVAFRELYQDATDGFEDCMKNGHKHGDLPFRTFMAGLETLQNEQMSPPLLLGF